MSLSTSWITHWPFFCPPRFINHPACFHKWRQLDVLQSAITTQGTTIIITHKLCLAWTLLSLLVIRSNLNPLLRLFGSQLCLDSERDPPSKAQRPFCFWWIWLWFQSLVSGHTFFFLFFFCSSYKIISKIPKWRVPHCWKVARGDIMAVQNHWQDTDKVADWLQVG